MNNVIAVEEYKNAKKLGLKKIKEATAKGEPTAPVALSDILEGKTTIGEYDLGIIEIPLSRVVGTRERGRMNAFSPDFLPVFDEASEFASKWTNLYQSQLDEGIRDPIEVYEYKQLFYVQEGNKRVSVLKYLKAPSVFAHVKRLLPAKTAENDVYYEFLDFYNHTGMYDILLTEKGDYKKLLAFVNPNGSEKPWSKEERRNFQSIFYYFVKSFNEFSSKKNSLTVDQAFLKYLSLQTYEEVYSKRYIDIKNELSKMKSEYAGKYAQAEYAMEPKEKKAPLLNVGAILNQAQSVALSAADMESKVSIAFLYDAAPENSSWTYTHELGRRHLEAVYGHKIDTRFYVRKPEETDYDFIERAINDNNRFIFTISPRFIKASAKHAMDHPEVDIMNCSLDMNWHAVRSYYARIHESKFILGLLAGAMSTDSVIGYEADYPFLGTVAGINAFAMGVSMVRPDAKVKLFWSSMKDELQPKCSSSLEIFCSKDMITSDHSSTNHFGLFRNRSLTSNNGSKENNVENLATTLVDWGIFYEKIIKEILTGVWKKATKDKKNINYYYGMGSDIVQVVYSSCLSHGITRMLDTYIDMIKTGTFHPFEGILYDQNGNPHGEEGKIFNAYEIVNMDWLYENIIGEIPEKDQLKEKAKEIVSL